MLLDISMPQMNGLEAVKIIKNLSPNTKVLMLSMHEEPEYVIKSLKSGANGYLLKNIEREELLKAIREVAGGRAYFQGNLAQSVMKQFMQEATSNAHVASTSVNTLSEREKEILQLVADGLSTKQIAKKLFISPRTVEAHRASLIKKTGAQNAAELVKLAAQYGLLASPNRST
jgi:DNA-binding NarL/FixJ family response regulator